MNYKIILPVVTLFVILFSMPLVHAGSPSSVSLASIGADSGSPVIISANTIGGTLPYAYNFTIYNSGGLVANALYNSVSSTSNSFTFVQNSFWGTGTFTVNVVVTDGSPGMASASQTYTVANTVTTYLPSVLPQNIISYIPITFSNSQNAPEPANSNLEILINASNYISYESSGLTNLEFFYGNGTIVPSWLEGNALNGQQNTNLNTADNVIYWIRIASGNFLPAYSTNTIYLGFAANTVNLFDGVVVGEAPQLSSSYAQYDNGANVFALYFDGDTSPSDFNAATGVTVSQATSVSYGSDTINAINIQGKYNCGCHYFYGVSLATPFPNTEGIIVESNFENLNTGADQGVASIVDNAVALNVKQAISVDQGYGGSYFSQTTVSGGSVSPDHNGYGSIGASTWLYGTLTYASGNSNSWNGMIAPQLYYPASGHSATLSGNPLSSVTNLYIGLIGYLNSGNSNNWNEDLNWMRARVYPINGAQPQVSTEQLTITPSNSLLDYGQYLSYTFPLQGGTGPYTPNIVASNGMVIETLNNLNKGTVAFSGFVPPVGTDSYNVIITDTGTTPAAYFYSASNSITVENAPTITLALNSTSILEGQGVAYTVNVPSYVGVGPFTVNIIFDGNVIATNTLSSGNSISGNYITSIHGTFSIYAQAIDNYTTTPFQFNSVSTDLTVLSLTTTSTTATTTIPGGLHIIPSGGGSPGSTSSSETTIPTTMATTTTQPMLSTTIIPNSQPVQVNATSEGQSPQLCTDKNGTIFVVEYPSIGSSFGVVPSGTGCYTISAFNATAQTNVPMLPENLTELKAVNVTISKGIVEVNATLSYPCNISSGMIAPYILENGTWNPIPQFTSNQAACTVTFSIPNDPLVALFMKQSSSLTTTSIEQQETNHSTSSYYIAAAVFIVVVILILVASRKNKNNRS
jgi:hypothetical protein